MNVNNIFIHIWSVNNKDTIPADVYECSIFCSFHVFILRGIYVCLLLLYFL